MRGLARQALTMVFGRGIIRVAQLIAFVFLARALTPAEFGWYGIIISAITLTATLGTLGLRQSFAYEIGQERLTPGQAVGTSLAIVPVMFVACGIVIALLYGDRILALEGGMGPLIIGLALLGALFMMLLQGVFLGRGAITSFMLSESLPRLILLVSAVALGVMGLLNLTSSLWIQAATLLVPMPLLVYLAIKGTGRIGTAFRRLGPMIRYGLVVAFNTFVVMLSTRVSMFVIEHFVGAAASGQFFAAIRVTEIFLDIATAVGLVLFSRNTRNKDTRAAVTESVTITGSLFWMFALIAAVMALAAPILLTVAVGDSYAGAVPALQILAIGLAPSAAHKIIYPALAGSGKPAAGTPALLTSFGVTLTLALILVPWLGLIGGAVAFVIGQFALLIGYAITCRVRFGVPIHAMFVPQPAMLRGARDSVMRRLRGRRATGRDDEEKPPSE